jgi:hypothetical protein
VKKLVKLDRRGEPDSSRTNCTVHEAWVENGFDARQTGQTKQAQPAEDEQTDEHEQQFVTMNERSGGRNN